MTKATAAQLLRTAREDGGFTVTPAGGPGPSHGYAVSIHGREVRIPLAMPDPAIESLIQAYADHMPPYHYTGGWVSGDHLVLDASVVVDSLDGALMLGYNHHQEAVYCIHEGREIPVSLPGAATA